MSADLPRRPDDLTPAWLTHALGVPVEGVQVEPIVALGGVNGEAFRLRLRGRGAPASVIAKFPAPGAASRSVAAYQRWYEREVRFYRELAAASPFRTPRLLWGEIEPDDDYLLLLEDLGAWRQGDQVASCTVDEAHAAVTRIATLHGHWWSRADAVDWLPRTTVGLDRARPVGGAFARAWTAARGRPEFAASREALDAAVQAYPALLRRIAEPPLTLCHGDYRLDNLFFRGDARALEVAAIDWQFACGARGAYDVGYFLGLDLEPETRRAHEEALIDAYAGALREAGVEGYGREEAWADYRVSLILGLAVFVIGSAGEMANARMRRVHDLGLARLARAIEETGALEAL